MFVVEAPDSDASPVPPRVKRGAGREWSGIVMVRAENTTALVVTLFLGLWLSGFSVGELRAGDPSSFSDWLADVRREAAREGISDRTLERALTGLEPLRRVVKEDRNQAEFELNLKQYRQSFLSEKMVSRGRRLREKHAPVLEEVASSFGVAPRYLVAIWGIESRYGGSTPSLPVITALATLGYDRRRSRFFREELMKALRILDEGLISLENMRGSWAGAMGQPQFLPSSYLEYAVDFNRDGRRDIWETEADVFASIANYLEKHGWVEGGGWGDEVEWPPSLKPSGVPGPGASGRCRAMREMTEMRPLAEWRDLGFHRSGGGMVPDADKAAALVRPDGEGGPAFLVYRNYRVLLHYNCAHHYALTVATLADRIAGGENPSGAGGAAGEERGDSAP